MMECKLWHLSTTLSVFLTRLIWCNDKHYRQCSITDRQCGWWAQMKWYSNIQIFLYYLYIIHPSIHPLLKSTDVTASCEHVNALILIADWGIWITLAMLIKENVLSTIINTCCVKKHKYQTLDWKAILWNFILDFILHLLINTRKIYGHQQLEAVWWGTKPQKKGPLWIMANVFFISIKWNEKYMYVCMLPHCNTVCVKLFRAQKSGQMIETGTRTDLWKQQ